MVRVAICILPWGEGYLCQLRDNVPHIRYPGQWGLFGGHLEAGEDAETALMRELKEEINLDAKGFRHVGDFSEDNVMRHVFEHRLSVPPESLTLLEGWDMAVLTKGQIESGSVFSERAGMEREVAKATREIFAAYFRHEMR